MKLYLLLPICILLASCSNSLTSTTPHAAGAPSIASPHHTTSSVFNSRTNDPYEVAQPATNTGTTGVTGGNAIQAVRGAREAASTVQTFRNLFGTF